MKKRFQCTTVYFSVTQYIEVLHSILQCTTEYIAVYLKRNICDIRRSIGNDPAALLQPQLQQIVTM